MREPRLLFRHNRLDHGRSPAAGHGGSAARDRHRGRAAVGGARPYGAALGEPARQPASVGHPTTGLHFAHAPQLGFVMALAVVGTVDALAGPGTAVKWPNDIMRDSAKLAGILLETCDDGTVLAGTGVNVRHSPPGMPYPVTCLQDLGCDASAPDVMDRLLAELRLEWDAWQSTGFGPVLQRWCERGPLPGAALRVRTGSRVLSGRFAGLRADGALLLQTAETLHAIVAGDVQPCAGADVCPER